jgi:hypothetical protein
MTQQKSFIQLVHRCTQKGDEIAPPCPPQQIFEKIVNKNPIKSKIGDPLAIL